MRRLLSHSFALTICLSVTYVHAAIGPTSETVRPTSSAVYVVLPTTLSSRAADVQSFDIGVKQLKACLQSTSIVVERIIADRLVLRLPEYDLMSFPWEGPHEADGVTPGVVLFQPGTAPYNIMINHGWSGVSEAIEKYFRIRCTNAQK